VSKATRVTAQVQSQGERVRNVIQVRFKPGPEDCYGVRKVRSDKMWQTVPEHDFVVSVGKVAGGGS